MVNLQKPEFLICAFTWGQGSPFTVQERRADKSSSFRTSGSAATMTGASEHVSDSTQRNELRINRAHKIQNTGETEETEHRRNRTKKSTRQTEHSRRWTDCRGK
jgi:hypothetical protein